MLEIIYSDEKVGVTSFQAITMEKLLYKLNVANIGSFTLYLHADGIIERCQQAKRLQYPSEIFVNEASVSLILVLLEASKVICSVVITLRAKIGQLLFDNIYVEAFCQEAFKMA